MGRFVRFLLLLVLLCEACTRSSGHDRPPARTSSSANGASTSGPPALTLDIVATASGVGTVDDSSYIEGMRLAISEVNASRGLEGWPLALAIHDDMGNPNQATTVMSQLLDQRPPAIVYVGPGPALAPLRTKFEQTGVPVLLLQGDLYTGHGMFPQSFQTTSPWEWQAKVIARYLVKDRRAKRIVFVGVGPEAAQAKEAARSQLEYWGGSLAGAVTLLSSSSLGSVSRVVSGADAVIDFGPPTDSFRVADAVAATSRPHRVAASEALLATPGPDRLRPGTVACYTNTWDGWAQPIPRVGRFASAFRSATGQARGGLEQEGYDAVRLLAQGLAATGGRGGPALVQALEAVDNRTLSSFPIGLSPDDHVFLPRDELGLFAIPGPGERLDPWQAGGGQLWRPIMRTFTYDGRRDAILDMDKGIFSPSWRKDQPGPYYWQSRYGIVSRPSDRLH